VPWRLGVASLRFGISFIDRYGGCYMANPQIFSGYIKANAGFSTPAPFDGPSGWTVCKNGQTEIYQIRHNLHLVNPAKQMHITVTSMNAVVLPTVQSMSSDGFVITTLRSDSGAADESDLMFIAAYYPNV